MEENPRLDLAWKFIEQTATHIFLTGRAGTGKTTFLRRLKERSPKRMVVVAPTGVAAVNAGGVTVHSFFQLPPGPYLPGQEAAPAPRMNFNGEKRALIRSLDLLVIDEISMVRADLLDAISDVLKRLRGSSRPFGGVQLLLIGDLQQLAPVVRPQEWELLRTRYASPYFFDSTALRAAEYLTLELRHIYRQRDEAFIELLNRVRENAVDRATLERLNSRCIAGFDPEGHEGYITLTSHNDTARAINERRMEALNTPAYTFECEVEGEFPEYLDPTDRCLRLKKGAQVMFIRNDPTGRQRYFNGKIGRIAQMDAERIEVETDDSPEPIEVEAAEWTNLKYGIDERTQQITQRVEGVFRQFPLRPAWAITIHKSQGLTFERVVIDAANAFSHGQVYVALSRCRSFEGLVLRTPLRAESIVHDRAVGEFGRTAARNQPDEALLARKRREYFRSLLIELFDFGPLAFRLKSFGGLFDRHLGPLYPRTAEAWRTAGEQFSARIGEVSIRFRRQLEQLTDQTPDPGGNALLTERIVKGQAYFLRQCEEILRPVLEQEPVETDNREIRKQLDKARERLEEELAVKRAVLGIDCSSGFAVGDYLAARAAAAGKSATGKGAARSGRQPGTQKLPAQQPEQDIVNPELFERLRGWRARQAAQAGVPVYVVMRQQALLAICRELPRDTKQLGEIKGVGKTLLKKYGPQVLALVEEWRRERDC